MPNSSMFRRAAGGRDLLFFAESERVVRSAQAETATEGSARAEARVKSACLQEPPRPAPRATRLRFPGGSVLVTGPGL